MVMEQPAQFWLPIENLGSEKFLVGIAHTLSNHRTRHNDPTIQPTIFHSNQETGWVHSDWEYFHIGSLKSGTDVRSGGFGKNIDYRTGLNTQVPIRTIIPDINSAPTGTRRGRTKGKVMTLFAMILEKCWAWDLFWGWKSWARTFKFD